MNNSLLKKWKFMNNLHLTLTKTLSQEFVFHNRNTHQYANSPQYTYQQHNIAC